MFEVFTNIGNKIWAISAKPQRSEGIHIRPTALGKYKTLTIKYGRLAQLVAHLNDIQGVTGSSPVSPTI